MNKPSCPVCRSNLSGRVTAQGLALKPLDVLLCGYCASVLEFRPDGAFYEMTHSEVAALPATLRGELADAMVVLSKIHGQRSAQA